VIARAREQRSAGLAKGACECAARARVRVRKPLRRAAPKVFDRARDEYVCSPFRLPAACLPSSQPCELVIGT